MKRKDTKIYSQLVSKYCDARWLVEHQENEINENLLLLGKAKNRYDEFGTAPILDDEVRKWYDGYTSIINTTIGIMKSNLRYDKEKMEESGSILVDEYEEDLDLLYSQNKKY